jgi:hypothetical protein
MVCKVFELITVFFGLCPCVYFIILRCHCWCGSVIVFVFLCDCFCFLFYGLAGWKWNRTEIRSCVWKWKRYREIRSCCLEMETVQRYSKYLQLPHYSNSSQF